MRSRMPFRPSERALARSAAAMPRPSSSTSTLQLAVLDRELTQAFFAPEWRAMLVSDSCSAR